MSSKTAFTRRRFMKSVAAGAGAVSVPAVLTGCFGDDDDNDSNNNSNGAPIDNNVVFAFGHGVASGDPLSDRVIIWTRVTPDDEEYSGTVNVAWAVYHDEQGTQVFNNGITNTDASKDFTVKLDITGLQPDTTYYYQFAVSDEAASPVGQTKTLPTGQVDQVKMAVCSCSNYPAGLFNAYREMANSDADVIVHLGDYIYEYGSNESPTADAQVRAPEPVAELLTLSEYRERYAQYRSDTYLQLAHQNKPFICIWDDHEVANDSYKNGAENHNDGEGSWTERMNAAVQAYHEWLPIRSGSDLKAIYRTFDFGDLVSLHMLETRLLARSEQLGFADIMADSSVLMSADRTLMGDTQVAQVQQWMSDSNAVWQVIGQQVLMGRMNVPMELLTGLGTLQSLLSSGGDADAAQQQLLTMLSELVTIKQRVLQGDSTLTDEERARVTTVVPYNLDAWDGYMYNREQLLQTSAQLQKNTIVLAGDTHNAWANDIYLMNTSTGAIDRSGDPAAVEFATGSVTSPGFERYLGLENSAQPAQMQENFEMAVTTLVDDLKYLNAADRGYMMVTYTQDKASAEWFYVSTIRDSEYSVSSAGPLAVTKGAGNRRIEMPDA